MCNIENLREATALPTEVAKENFLKNVGLELGTQMVEAVVLETFYGKARQTMVAGLYS